MGGDQHMEPHGYIIIEFDIDAEPQFYNSDFPYRYGAFKPKLVLR